MSSLHAYRWILVILIQIHLIIVHSDILSKTVHLTPSNPSQNGASVTIIKNISIIDNKWLITSTDQTGFHLSLQLDSKWSSNPIKITKLTLEINSNTPISNTTNNLIVSFTQNSIHQFITTILSIDNSNDHILYPECNIFTAKPWAIYNININTSFINKLTNNYQSGHFIPSTIPPNTAYPLTFIIENNPFTHQMTFSYTIPDITAKSCIYKAMAPNNTLNIYFAAETFNISSINLTHSIYPFKKIDFELDDKPQKWWYEDWVTSWETIVIAIASICYCICCIVMVCKCKKRREQRENDRKLAYALQMANSTPSYENKGNESEIINRNKSNTLNEMQKKNAAIAIPQNIHLSQSQNKSTDNLVSSTGNITENDTRGLIYDQAPNSDVTIAGVVIKSAPMDYEPTGDSYAPSPPLPPSTAPEPRFD